MLEETRVEELLAAMTVAEKISLCHAGSKFSAPGVPRLGIPEFTMSDGPHGVRRELVRDGWDPLDCDWDFATYLPTGTALAATWDMESAAEFGRVLGEEARARGKDIILGPGVNMVRSPLCGRNFEYYGEDPYQVGELASVCIRSIQEQGVAACVKHYALNSQELNRNGVDARPDERTLRELYLPAFEKAVRAGGVWSLMGAYNLFRGQYCCQNDYLLNQILKKEWNFDGVVISDWGGVHDTFEAARGGMDLEMGSNVPTYDEYYLGRPFREAVEKGEVEAAFLDDKVRRILRLLNRVGLLDNTVKKGAFNTPDHQAAARNIARKAMVLLKNEDDVLPLDRTKIKRLLVVGDNATEQHHAGGHSSAVKALYEITPLEGLKNLLGNTVEIEYFRGYPDFSSAGTPIPAQDLAIVDPAAGTGGWMAEYFDNRDFRGTPFKRVPMADADIAFAPAELDTISVRLSAAFTPKKDWKGTLLMDDCRQGWFKVDGETILNLSVDTARNGLDFEFKAGQTYRLAMELQPRKVDGPTRVVVRLLEQGGSGAEDEAILAAAKHADAVLFFGGLNHFYDTESSDRRDMALHGGQNELIAKLARVTPRLVVGLVGGSPMEMPWLDAVPAVFLLWYGGMEVGNAAAELLFGEANFSGRLPFTFPRILADSPAHAIGDYEEKVCNYREGVFMGYRWFDAKGVQPLFPFGHGLSYTRFQTTNLKAHTCGDFRCEITADVKNCGERAGAIVLQLYVADLASSIPRPPKELKAFARVELQPGECKKVAWSLEKDAFSFYDPVAREWVAEPGEFKLLLGASAETILQETSLRFV